MVTGSHAPTQVTTIGTYARPQTHLADCHKVPVKTSRHDRYLSCSRLRSSDLLLDSGEVDQLGTVRLLRRPHFTNAVLDLLHVLHDCRQLGTQRCACPLGFTADLEWTHAAKTKNACRQQRISWTLRVALKADLPT